MKDYDIWYAGSIIGNLQSDTDRRALNLAKKMFKTGKRGTIAVSALDANDEEVEKARAASIILPN